VRNEVRVVAAERRNRNFRVIVAGGPSYLVKQAKTGETVASLTHEADVLQALAHRRDRLTRHLPTYVDFDRARVILVLELVPGGQSLNDIFGARRRFTRREARSIGRVLALVHRRQPPTGLGDGSAPPALMLHRPRVGLLSDLSRGNLRLLEAAQSDPAFNQALDDLRRSWRPTSLMHGDVKWDNLVRVSRSDDGGPDRLLLVDWELAGPGDPHWDVGTVLSGFLSSWVLSIPMAGGESPQRLLRLAMFPLQRLQPAVQGFWSGYVATAGMTATDAKEYLEIAMRHAAGRLIQTAFEYLQMTTQLSANAVSLVQLGANIMRAPRTAATALLGLPAS
jgi:hypothetical protein